MIRIKKPICVMAACCAAAITMAQPAYDYSKLQREDLGRGVVAFRER